MKIAVFSDIHENFHNLRLALEEMQKRNIKEAFFLGDFMNPGILKEILASDLHIYAVWGNNDGEKSIITKVICQSNGKFEISDTTFAQREVDGKKVFLTHHPDFARSLAKSGDFNAVFYGHNHLEFLEVLENGCILANPGEISSHKTGRCTFLIWNTGDNKIEQIEIANPLNTNS